MLPANCAFIDDNQEFQEADQNLFQFLPFAYSDFPDAEFYLPQQQPYFPFNQQELDLFDNLGILMDFLINSKNFLLERISEGEENFELISQDESHEIPFPMFPMLEWKPVSNDNFVRKIELVRTF